MLRIVLQGLHMRCLYSALNARLRTESQHAGDCVNMQRLNFQLLQSLASLERGN